MAISFDAQARGEWTGTGGTFTLVPVGTPKGIAVLVAAAADVVDRNLSVAYGGSPLARFGSFATAGAAENGAVYAFFRGSVVPTSGTVSVTHSAGGTFIGWGLTMTAASDTQVLYNGSVHSDAAANPTITLPSSAGDTGLAVGVLFSGANALSSIAVGSGYTALTGPDGGTSGTVTGKDFGSQTAVAEYGSKSGANINVDWVIASSVYAALGGLITEISSSGTDATVTGVRASATGTAQPGTPLITGTGTQGSSTAASNIGGVLVSLLGVRATATATGQAGTTSPVTVIGTRATATAAGQAGSFGTSVSVAGAQASATATAQPGAYGLATAWYGAVVSGLQGVRASATATAQPGTVRLDQAVVGVRATATATGQGGNLLVGGNVTLSGVQATATAAAQPGAPVVTLTGELASAAATTQPGKTGLVTDWYGGVTSDFADINIPGVQAVATVTAQPGSVSVAGNNTVTGVRAIATADARPGGIFLVSLPTMGPGLAFLLMSGRTVGIIFQGARATATATGQGGTLSSGGDAMVAGARAAATGTAQPGTTAVSVTGVQASATATAQPGTPSTQLDAALAGSQASATATGQAGTPATAATGSRALATAAGQQGFTAVSLVGTRAGATGTGQGQDVYIVATGQRAAATATSVPGASIFAGGNLTFIGDDANATATAQPGTVRLDQTVIGTQAAATAAGAGWR